MVTLLQHGSGGRENYLSVPAQPRYHETVGNLLVHILYLLAAYGRVLHLEYKTDCPFDARSVLVQCSLLLFQVDTEHGLDYHKYKYDSQHSERIGHCITGSKRARKGRSDLGAL